MAFGESTEANRLAKPHLERMRTIYGHTPGVVYFVQWQPDGPVKIGTAERLVTRLESFLTTSPDALIVRHVMPGGQPLEHWWHTRHRERWLRREWYTPAGPIIDDAVAFSELQASAFAASGSVRAATVEAIRQVDGFLRDCERFYKRGWTIGQIAELADREPPEIRRVLERMRTLGFDIGHRRVYASRTPRFEEPTIPRETRLIG